MVSVKLAKIEVFLISFDLLSVQCNSNAQSYGSLTRKRMLYQKDGKVTHDLELQDGFFTSAMLENRWNTSLDSLGLLYQYGLTLNQRWK